jgi:acyl-CoA thioester hydrolase
MQPFISSTTVSYSDTDQMGFAHHSNYLKYYETARWELFRHLGIPYKKIEDKGFLLPVIQVQMQFLKPAFYDEELTIETSIDAIRGAKLILDYKMFNPEQELINTAKITVAFVSFQSRKPCKPPVWFEAAWSEHLQRDKKRFRTNSRYAPNMLDSALELAASFQNPCHTSQKKKARPS